MSEQKPIINLRAYQQSVFRHQAGILAQIWRRQSGKSYYLGVTGLDWMMERICDTFYVSAAVRLGVENIRKEAAIWADCFAALQRLGGRNVESNALDDKGALLDMDAVADLFEAQKLETRFRHGYAANQVSRSIVVAPNPDTAVGWTGNVIMDEVGRIPEFRDVWEAMEPIVSANPEFRVRMATTPPPDDSHYSYEMLAPDPAEKFAVNRAGNFYTSAMGLLVHRVDAWDGYEAGVPLYDLKSREGLTPEQHRDRSIDKTAWDRNYGVKFISGGSAALSLMSLMNAQAAGAERGLVGVNITEALDDAA